MSNYNLILLKWWLNRKISTSINRYPSNNPPLLSVNLAIIQVFSHQCHRSSDLVHLETVNKTRAVLHQSIITTLQVYPALISRICRYSLTWISNNILPTLFKKTLIAQKYANFSNQNTGNNFNQTPLATVKVPERKVHFLMR